MKTAIAQHQPSPHFRQIECWVRQHERPYSAHDIHDFNRLYRRSYPLLSQEEKRRAELEIVDLLIEGVEDPKLKARIYGVC